MVSCLAVHDVVKPIFNSIFFASIRNLFKGFIKVLVGSIYIGISDLSAASTTATVTATSAATSSSATAAFSAAATVAAFSKALSKVLTALGATLTD